MKTTIQKNKWGENTWLEISGDGNFSNAEIAKILASSQNIKITKVTHDLEDTPHEVEFECFGKEFVYTQFFSDYSIERKPDDEKDLKFDLDPAKWMERTDEYLDSLIKYEDFDHENIDKHLKEIQSVFDNYNTLGTRFWDWYNSFSIFDYLWNKIFTRKSESNNS